MRGSAEKVREMFLRVKKFPAGCNREIAEACGIREDAVRYTIRDFIRRGEIKVENGMYVYVPRRRKESLADRIWKAFRYTPSWTINEIARLTGADVDTIRSYVWQYSKAGYIERIGRRSNGFGIEAIYRLKDKRRERPCLPKRRLMKKRDASS